MAYPYYTPYYPTYQSYQPTTGIVWVNSASEAQAYPIAPNNAVVLWEKSGKSIYLKQADATGKPTITTYDLAERAETPSANISQEEVKLPAYATKSELDAISSVLSGFDASVASAKSEIDSLKADIETMKADMYGIAGKRKKKVTEDE